MGTLTFACPRTGKPIESGVETDAYTFRSIRNVVLRVRCQHCDGDHEFCTGEGALLPAA
jgi:hypothetical protein